MTEMERDFWRMVEEEEQRLYEEAIEEDLFYDKMAEEALGYQQWVAQGYECY